MPAARGVKETKLYDALEIDPSASEADVKKAFRKLAVKCHPDKGGDAEKFKEISKAYEILSDADKRKRYDQYGEDGIDGSSMHGAEDVFASFFGGMFGGGGGGGGRREGPRKGEDVVQALNVTLENLYNGRVAKLAVTRNVVCESCEGSGSKVKGADTVCPGCHGSCVRIITRQLGPMLQQMQTVCPDCKGQGSVIKDKDKCKQCNGNKVVQERKVLEVNIDKGMRHGQKVAFPGEADEAPGMIPGDVIFVLQQKEHDRFHRKGDDLLVLQKITLVEALCGTQFVLSHLDDRKLLVKTKPGQVIKPGDVMMLPEEGMPMYKNPFVKGNLFIKFEIEFPARLSAEQQVQLEKLLGPRPQLTVPMDAEEHTLQPANLEQMGASNGGGHDATNEDHEGHGHRQHVQCGQQ